jgi:archaellum component FlaC
MKSEKVRELIERLESLHREFESKFPVLYEEKSMEGLYETLKGLYSIVGRKIGIIGDIYKEMSQLGREVEITLKELQKTEHQMKFRLEELMTLLSKPLGYSERTRLKLLLDRLVHFHRMYDYTLSRGIQVLTKEAEGLEFMEKMGIESENQKKAPASIIERLEKINEIEEKLEKLLKFTRRLYSHPGDVHKVEEALKRWHRMGLLWVEARNVEKISGVKNPDEILEGLTLIGVVERKRRGGESVYRHRSFS